METAKSTGYEISDERSLNGTVDFQEPFARQVSIHSDKDLLEELNDVSLTIK